MSKITKKIIESSGFNLIGVYLSFFLSIFGVFIIARLITPEEWALIILTISFVHILIFISNFFPPAAEGSIQYYIPYLNRCEDSENNNVRELIFHIYKIRLISIVLIYPIFFLTILFANLAPKLLEIIFIITPMFFFQVIMLLNSSFLLAIQKFKKVFQINILNSVIHLILLLAIFLLKIQNAYVLISYTYLISSIFTCAFSTLLIIPLIPVKKEDEFKTTIGKRIRLSDVHKKYGKNIILSATISLCGSLIMNLLFLTSGFIVYITYIAICESIVSFSLKFTVSDKLSYISIFSEIDYHKNSKMYTSYLYLINKFSILFICTIVGVLYFFLELFIIVIYTEVYLLILIPLQIIIFTAISRAIDRNLMIIPNSTNHTKINVLIVSFQMALNVIMTIIGLLYFNFLILIILYTIQSFLSLILLIFLVEKIVQLKLKFTTIFRPFLIFLISFLITLPITFLINFQFSTDNNFYNFLNIGLNTIFKTMVFISIFYISLIITKTITRNEFNKLVEIIPILHSEKLMIKKMVKFIEKILPPR